jgi:YD repeat-containing protein
VEGVMSVNQPLEGVRISVDGLENELFAVTDQNGNFRLDSAPTGRFFVHIDGRSATTALPDGAYYPFVGKTWESEAGIEVNVGEIFLPLVRGGTLQSVSDVDETTVGFASAVVAEFPEFADVSLTVPPGVLFNDAGEPGGMVGIAPVDPARLPGPLPAGLAFPLVITVQTDGATNFDQPVPVCFPNLPDPETGFPLLPGERSGLWSFNHDTGAWEVVGSMTVSLDGTLVCSDPGSGILAPGWHGSRRGTQGGGGSIVRRGGGSESDAEPGGSSRSRNCPDNGESCPEITEQDPGKKDTDPVYLFSGEFYLDVEDLKIPGRGKDFVWARKYRSKIGPSTGMGNQWDYSYNIFIEREGDGLLLADGNSRRDRYPVRPSGSFARAEFFREFVEVSPNTFHLVFSDRGRWEFNSLDNGSAAGKISTIIDRNGNTIRIFYDDFGRLDSIIDTLDREIDIAWNEAGLIESVTDFSGRMVRYDYFGETEEGGNPHDLKSVTSPAVAGTTTGNDFPIGKQVSYTYTTGFDDERLNHNLLTMTDGRRNDPNDPTFGEGPFLRNQYAPTADPDDLDFDRIVSQAWGGEDDLIHFHYSELRPSPANGESVVRAILNDRNGNVRETFYDRRNRMTRLIEFTGRADADLVTTPTSNRPVRKLRSADPAFYVTSYGWNGDSQMTRVLFPNGNEKRLVYESDLNPAAGSRSRGNLRQVVWSPGSHQPAGDQETIVQRFEYQTDFNFGCCNFNFVTAHFDGRGNVTRNDYDERGNRVRTTHRIEAIVMDYEYNEFGQLVSQTLPDNGSDHRRVDTFSYYDSGSQRGYRSQRVEDASGFKLTAAYEYDLVGNVIRQIDPRGNDMLVEVNELNQVVRMRRTPKNGPVGKL